MKIELKLNGVNYHIEVETSCFAPYKHGETKDGKSKEECLGYPSTLSRSIHMIIKDSMASSDEAVSLLEYVERYEACQEELKKQVEFEF